MLIFHYHLVIFAMIHCTTKTILIILIVIILKEPFNDVNDTGNFALQKLLLIYTNGHFVTLSWSKNFTLIISQSGLIERDVCGYFGFSEYHIRLFSNVNTENKTRILNQQLSLKTAKIDHFPFEPEIDSTLVETRSYIWLIGQYSIFNSSLM